MRKTFCRLGFPQNRARAKVFLSIFYRSRVSGCASRRASRGSNVNALSSAKSLKLTAGKTSERSCCAARSGNCRFAIAWACACRSATFGWRHSRSIFLESVESSGQKEIIRKHISENCCPHPSRSGNTFSQRRYCLSRGSILSSSELTRALGADNGSIRRGCAAALPPAPRGRLRNCADNVYQWAETYRQRWARGVRECGSFRANSKRQMRESRTRASEPTEQIETREGSGEICAREPRTRQVDHPQ
jgi:hypothetical protein